MNSKFERRLKRIQESISQKSTGIYGMSDDELAQFITGNPNNKACDITDKQLEAMIREAKE